MVASRRGLAVPERTSRLKSFSQGHRLTDTDLTKTYYWGETGAGVTGAPTVDGYAPPMAVDPFWVRYEIDFIEPTGMYPIRVGPFNRIPLKTLSSTYYANFIVGSKWATGEYQIVWKSLMTGDTGVPYAEDAELFRVTSGGLYDVWGITGPVLWNECAGGSTGVIAETGVAPPTPGDTGVEPYSYVHVTYNTLSRYQVVDTAGEEVWVTSNATSFDGFVWARYGSIISVARKNHGLAIGDRVILRNTNVDYQSTLVTAVTTDSFSVTVANTGYTQGYSASYSRGFNYAHVGSPKTGGIVYPSSDDVKLLSIRIRTGERDSTTYDIEIPASALNDSSTSMGTSFIPMLSVRQDADNLSATSATIYANQAGSYSNYRVANLGNPAASRIIILMFG
jgi:hypothetical protein